jgi:hypothetical protein
MLLFFFDEEHDIIMQPAKNKKHLLIIECFVEKWHVVQVSDTTMFIID